MGRRYLGILRTKTLTVMVFLFFFADICNTQTYNAFNKEEKVQRYHLLDNINSIEDFKNTDAAHYDKLAAEIREFLIDNISKTGGHLASNLGVVELTMALHLVFDSPKDKIIFDVGHQSYVHKLLTGRKEQLDSLRKFGGLSSFPKSSESLHDVFNTGHASTSISAALGIMRAQRLQNQNDNVVALIGDGALTGGMAWEALDDAGQSKLPIIIVINDNGMSISRNVGAIKSHLSSIRASARYQTLKRGIIRFLQKIPIIGKPLYRRIERIKNRIKYFLMPNVLFEEMGFTYLGPIDGHNIKQLIKVFSQAKTFMRPTIIHVVTKKGRGYEPAQSNPEKFHGISPFCIETGAEINEKCSNSVIFGEAMLELAEQHPEIVAITAAMPYGTGLMPFMKLYPNRLFDVGIAEQHAVTMAAGMAAGGLKPVVAIYSSFIQRSYDQIYHDICLQNLPVILCLDRAGLVGGDGETHHGINDIGLLISFPGITIYSPASQRELTEMLKLAVSQNTPAAIRYSRQPLMQVQDFTPLEIGKWEVLRPLKAVNVIASGRMVESSLLGVKDLDVGIINARFLKPIDTAMLDRLTEISSGIVTVEDGVITNGLGSAVTNYLYGSGVKILKLGIQEKPVPHGSMEDLDRLCGMLPSDIGSAAKTLMDRV